MTPIVEFLNCPLPSGTGAVGALAAFMGAFNVTLQCDDWVTWLPFGGLVLAPPPSSEPLTAEHLAGLECAARLSVVGASLAPNFLAPLRNLRMLTIEATRLPAGALDVPPPLLEKVYLKVTNLERLPAALQTSSVLKVLRLKSKSSLDALNVVTPDVEYLTLASPATTLQLDVAPALEYINVARWTEPRPAPLRRCDVLRKMYLHAPAALALPNSWLANCSSLEVLKIDNAVHLTELPPNLLDGLGALTELILAKGSLELLPAQLLDHVPKLQRLDLSGNRLRTLPSDIFLSVEKRRYKFSDEVFLERGPLKELTVIDLSLNLHLGDLCKAVESPMKSLWSLSELKLRGTAVSHLCSDWRHLEHLSMIDLQETLVSELQFEDLKFMQVKTNMVTLYGAPLTSVQLTREDFNNAPIILAAAPYVAFKTWEEDTPPRLKCDCSMYWTRRALDLNLHALNSVGLLRCTDGRRLRDVPPEELECARQDECTAAALPPECACAVRPVHDAALARLVVRVHCHNDTLTRALRLPAHSADTRPRLDHFYFFVDMNKH